MMTMSDLCKECKNWFDKDRYFGNFVIENGSLVQAEEMKLLEGQYYRIIGSVFNDGVHQHPADDLKDESFSGAIWTMAVPPDFESLLKDINDWLTEHAAEADSPFQSESFAGYSYSLGSASNNNNLATGAVGIVLSHFSSVLNRWRKI